MRTLLSVVIPVDSGNKAIEDGALPKAVESFMQKFKPESAYFFAKNGKRSMQFVFDLSDPSDIPSVAEPFFFDLGADIEAIPVMNVDDLRKGLQKITK